MKRVKALAVIFISVLCFSLTAKAETLSGNAYHWTSYAVDKVSFWLKSYGLWENGQPVNRFTPSVQTGNNFEHMFIRRKGNSYYFCWACTADGDFRYRCRPDGNVLYLTGRCRGVNEAPYQPYNGWIKIIDVNGTMLLTVDNNNTYRYIEAMYVR